MLYILCCLAVTTAYILCDVNYFIRTLFTMIIGSLNRKEFSLNDTAIFYGIGTFVDYNICFRRFRLDRIIRELDFARYHYYALTKIYDRSIQHNIQSLQGCTLTITYEAISIFIPYKILTKLVFWDDKSLFFEHEVVTLHDGKIRCLLVSRQHAVGEIRQSTSELLEGLKGSETKPECPDYIKMWLRSMEITSKKLNITK